MTKEQAIERLKALQQSLDYEIAHCEADDILCKLLTELGHAEVVKEWLEVPKWYA